MTRKRRKWLSHGLLYFQIGLIENGLWFARSGPRNRQVSAVLLVDELMPWAIAHKTPVLWHNPWAQKPLVLNLWQGPQMLPNMNSLPPRMQYRDGKQVYEIFHYNR